MKLWTMQAAQQRARWLSAGSVGLSATLALVLSLANGPRTIDDAFITYRYAANLADGAGFVYNQDERVLGTTTPLYTLLLGAFDVLGFDLVHVSLLIGALAGAGSVCLVYLYTQHTGGTRLTAALTAALLAIALPATMGVGNGMEAHLFVLLVLSALILSSAGRPTASAAIAALAAHTRPEGFLALGLVLILIVVRERRALRSSLAVSAIIVSPWLVFSSLYFGSPVPNSMQAKSGDAFRLVSALPEGRDGRRLFTHFYETLFGPAWDFLGAGFGTSVWSLMWLVPLAFIALTFVRIVRRDSRFVTLVSFPIAYFVFHLLSNVSGVPIQTWYMSPLTLFYLSLTMTGVQIAARYVVRVHWPALSAASFLLLLVGQVAALDLSQGEAFSLSTRSNLERENLYARVASDLEPDMSPKTVIAALEIGALGFHSSALILDTIGLVSPESSAFYPMDPREAVLGVENAMPTDLILKLKPDYIVSLEVFVRESLLKSYEFERLYESARFYPGRAFGSKGLYVFRIRE